MNFFILKYKYELFDLLHLTCYSPLLYFFDTHISHHWLVGPDHVDCYVFLT